MHPGCLDIIKALRARWGRKIAPGSPSGGAWSVVEPSGEFVSAVSYYQAVDLWASGHTRPIGKDGAGFELVPAEERRADAAGELIHTQETMP